MALFSAFLLLAPAPGGCGEGTGTNGERPVHCEVLVDGPVKSEDGSNFHGTARFTCDKPGADALTLAMKLERRDGDNWHTVASRTHTVRGADTTTAEAFDHQSRTVEMRCATGTFRTVIDWNRRSRGNDKGDNLVSGVMKNPCSSNR